MQIAYLQLKKPQSQEQNHTAKLTGFTKHQTTRHIDMFMTNYPRIDYIPLTNKWLASKHVGGGRDLSEYFDTKEEAEIWNATQIAKPTT